MNSVPFPYYTNSGAAQQSQPQAEQPQQLLSPNQNPELSHLLVQHHPLYTQQSPPASHLQFQGQHLNPQYLQYQQPGQFMTTPLQTNPQSQGIYSHNQTDVQNRLAHLQLQHPQQLPRPEKLTPSPTRTTFQAPSQGYSSNPNRVIVNRNPSQFSRNILDRAESTRIKLEHLYKVSVEQAVERNQRYITSIFVH